LSTINSSEWKTWIAELDLSTCLDCKNRHGKIYAADEFAEEPPIHEYCRCIIKYLLAILVGNATINGKNGADMWVYLTGQLPDYYITKEQAKALGWKSWKGNLANVAPNKMLNGGIFQNSNKKLPSANGRVWYEADINYTSGYRNGHRLLYSNDGLLFATYDHYETFVEIV